MPIYLHECTHCKENGLPKQLEFFRFAADSSKRENCPVCGKPTKRIYTFQRQKEFVPFYDEQYRTWISSQRQENQLMRINGQVPTSAKEQAKRIPQLKQAMSDIKLKTKKKFHVKVK